MLRSPSKVQKWIFETSSNWRGTDFYVFDDMGFETNTVNDIMWQITDYKIKKERELIDLRKSMVI